MAHPLQPERWEAIRRIVRSRLQRNLPIDDETPLISGGLIDSMSIVGLILDLQGEFAVEIPASEVHADNFDSVSKIGATVLRFLSVS